MPESYTHWLIASQALIRSGQMIASQPAYRAGACGPDPLLAYKPCKRKKKPDLPALVARLHTEKTGLFLTTLVKKAITPVQQSYVLGFLTHYAADCIMNPYIQAMSKKGLPYGMSRGKFYMKASIDATLYYRDYHTYRIPLQAVTPVLISEELGQITGLLHEALIEVYGVAVPAVILADAFHDNVRMQRFLLSRFVGKKLAASVFERLSSGSKNRGELRARMQPAPPLRVLPAAWTNPYTGAAVNQNFEEVLADAQEAAAVCVAGGTGFWLGTITPQQLDAVIGNNSYFTGLPVSARSAPAAAGGEASAEKQAENQP